MTDHQQEAERSAGGGKDKDSRNLATRRRQAHRDEVLEKLRNAGLVQQVIATAEKLADETVELDTNMVARLKAANDARLKLMAKYLPDVKSVEMTGEDGAPIQVNASLAVRFVDANPG